MNSQAYSPTKGDDPEAKLCMNHPLREMRVYNTACLEVQKGNPGLSCFSWQ
jgi:hypothetical protein